MEPKSELSGPESQLEIITQLVSPHSGGSGWFSAPSPLCVFALFSLPVPDPVLSDFSVLKPRNTMCLEEREFNSPSSDQAYRVHLC